MPPDYFSLCTCVPSSPLCLSPPQPYVPTEEEQMVPLPPNPFSELSEKALEEYRKNVERRQLGLSGTAHTLTNTLLLTTIKAHAHMAR